jgi:kynurenine formamidase
MRHPGIALVSLLLAGCIAEAPSETSTFAPRPAAADVAVGALVDLTHAYAADTIFWPTADPFALEVVADGITEGGYYYAANTFTTAEHGGTHLDAPLHFAEGAQAADEIPLERLMAPAVVVDVTASSSADPDYLITVGDVDAWEAEHGRLPDGVILLFRTGFSARWPDAEAYLGTAERGEAAVAQLHFPGLDPALAEWLVATRAVGAVGIDTASIDYGQSTRFETHRTLFAANIPAFENLTALDRVPPTGAYVVALPMKIAGGSGAPLRAVAILP